jgi:hypothetical protein
VSALAVLDTHAMLAELLAQARSRSTETLRAMYRQGTQPAAKSPMWVDVLFAIGVVLSERCEAEITRNGGGSRG